ncbi:MAG: biotin-dependent carboxyltransferase family protein [Sneathiella sp.]
MSACLIILSPGMLSTIQDKGRFGYGSYGVPRSGAIDPVSLRLGNALVGNDPYEAALEFRFMGPVVTAENGPIRIGLACEAGAELTDIQNNETLQISPWQTVTLNEGNILKVSALAAGATGYLTIEGGLKLEPVLESSSTYVRAKLGGLTGTSIQANDVLVVKQPAMPGKCERIMADPVQIGDGVLHVILGPQEDYFSEEEVEGFLNKPFIVSSDVDRMGIRLEGSKISTLREKGNDIISDGLVVGSIQIPGSGQPIILCSDCQTVGGYPKIATIISADLNHLGQMRPGSKVHFKRVNLNQAQALYLEMEKSIEASINSIQDYYGDGAVDLEALYGANLIGGVVDAERASNFPGNLEELV